MYKCGKCGEEVQFFIGSLIRCPNCAYKVFYKTRQPVARKVKAE